MIQTYMSFWAHENNWLVLDIPDADHFTDAYEEVIRHKSGLFMQPESTSLLLKNFKLTNQELLSEIDVNMEIYGKMDMAGNRDGDPEPMPRKWDQLR